MLHSVQNAFMSIAFGVIMRLTSPSEPKLFIGSGSIKKLYSYIKSNNSNKLLIVTTADLVQLNLLESTYSTLDQLGIKYVVFDKVKPNPSVSSVKEAISVYHVNGCDAVLAFGGGSVMDAAKTAALQIGNGTAVEKLTGFFRSLYGLLGGGRKAVPFYSVPTTAGTGSEATSVAVLSDDATNQKLFVADHKTIPLATALDPEPMLGLPPSITADTGMDALSHAVEAYISKVHTAKDMDLAANAVRLIFANLSKAYEDGTNIEARENMALASYQAGVAFNRLGVGFTHAISHQLTAFYDTPHGRANAIVLPHVLQASLEHIVPRLAELGKKVGLGEDKSSDLDIATGFIAAVTSLARSLDIPAGLSELREQDFPKIIDNARKEAIKNYPSPRFLSADEINAILSQIKTAT